MIVLLGGALLAGLPDELTLARSRGQPDRVFERPTQAASPVPGPTEISLTPAAPKTPDASAKPCDA